MRPSLILLALVPVTFACGRDVEAPGPSRDTISPATYAAVIADLSVARIETHPDTAAFESRREIVLDRHGVRGEDLWTFARARGEDDDVMLWVYERIGARLDSVFGDRSASQFPQPADTIRGTPDDSLEDLPVEAGGEPVPPGE